MDMAAAAESGIDAANNAFASGEYQRALVLWTELLNDTDPQHHHAVFTNMGACEERLGHIEAAIAAYDEALRLQPEHVEALHNRGVALKAAKRLGDALQSFDAALTNKPTFYPSVRGRCDILTHLGKYEEAIDAATFAMELCPKELGPVTDRAFAELKAKRLEDAIADYRRARSLFDDTSLETAKLFAIALSQRAVELDKAQQCTEAEKFYNEAIEIEATESRLFNRALLRMRLGRKAEALDGFLEVVAKNGDNAASLGALGTLLLEADKPADALPHLAKAHALRPEAADVAFNYGFGLLKCRNYEQAAEAFAQAQKLDPSLQAASAAYAAAKAALTHVTPPSASDTAADVSSAVTVPSAAAFETMPAVTTQPAAAVAAGGGSGQRKGSVSERFRGDVAMPSASLAAQQQEAQATRNRSISLVKPPDEILQMRQNLKHANSSNGSTASTDACAQALAPPPPRPAPAVNMSGSTTAAAVGAFDPEADQPAPGASPSRYFLSQPNGLDIDGYHGKTWAYMQLRAPGPYPEDTDIGHREAYLTSAEFFEVFGSSKQDFYRAPKWRRVQRKKDLGLF